MKAPSANDVDDYLVMSFLSLVLTLENIVIIIGVALLMFRVKKVVLVKDKNAPLWKSVTNFARRKKNAVKVVDKQGAWGNIKLRVEDMADGEEVEKKRTGWVLEQKMKSSMKHRSTIIFPSRHFVQVVGEKMEESKNPSPQKNLSPSKRDPTRLGVSDIFGAAEEPEISDLEMDKIEEEDNVTDEVVGGIDEKKDGDLA